MGPTCIGCGGSWSQGRFCPHCGLEQPEAPERDPLLGRTLGERYELVELLRAGGMGKVYRGLHRALERPVAVKIIHPELLGSSDVVSRFMAEARTLSRLNHPNVVNVYDFGRLPPSDGGHFFLVMELVEGTDLSTLIARGEQLSVARAVDIAEQVLGALAEAHELGIVHRDVKPENILVQRTRQGSDRAKLIDFGVATLGHAAPGVAAGRRITQHGQVVGTPHYMAPEQATGLPIGPVADLYALGATFFEMLTGHPPFEAKTIGELLAMHALAPRPDPRSVAPERGIPAALAAVTMRAFDCDPARRFQSAAELGEAIRVAFESSGDELADAGADAPRHPTPVSGVPTAASGIGTPVLPVATPVLRVATPVPGVAPRTLTPPPMSRVPTRPGVEPGALAAEGAPPSRRSGTGATALPALVGRDADLAWAEGALVDPGVDALLLRAPAGHGRSSVLAAIAARAEARGALVHRLRPDPAPLGTQSHRGLRALLACLSGLEPAALGAACNDPLVLAGLGAIYASDPAGPTSGVVSDRAPDTEDPDASERARAAVGAALEWAVRRAAAPWRSAAPGAGLVLALDDVDGFDGITRVALARLVCGPRVDGFKLVATSEGPMREWQSPGLHRRELAPVPAADLARYLAPWPRLARALEAAVAPSPLFVAELVRWAGEQPDADPPADLEALEAARLDGLPDAERRALATIAATGGGEPATLVAASGLGDAFAEAAWQLCERGLCALDPVDGRLHVRFEHVARASLCAADRAGELAALHGRIADTLGTAPRDIELRAHHALRAGRSEAYVLVELAAGLRRRAGDRAGAIALLSEGVAAARVEVLRGDTDASSAFVHLGSRLGLALARADRHLEARGVLTDVLATLGPDAPERARVLTELGTLSDREGHKDKAVQLWREALTIAERTKDAELGARLRAALQPTRPSAVRPRGDAAEPRAYVANGEGPPPRR
ncbi:MAG: protein kinase [Polyangiaceae bacterium]|nr:protein kinase [Polyangiaceae bacterium]